MPFDDIFELPGEIEGSDSFTPYIPTAKEEVDSESNVQATSIADILKSTNKSPEEQSEEIFGYKNNIMDFSELEQMKFVIKGNPGVQMAFIDIFQEKPELMCEWVQNELAINGNEEIILNLLFIFKKSINHLTSYALDTINSRFCCPDSKEFSEKIQSEVGGFCITH